VAEWAWLGRVSFEETARLQERLRLALIGGARADTLLLVEHPPVITLGRAANPAHVLASPEELSRDGISVARATRGGDVTYHGPGQLVAYPVVRLRAGVRAHVRAMADAVIDLLSEGWGIEAHYRDEAPGVWVMRGGQPAKIAALGINVHHRVAVHGLALNLDPALDHFARIVPCGLTGIAVTSVAELTRFAGSLAPGDWAARLADALGRRLGIALRRRSDPTELLCQATPLE
jgi:lipoate-protein ligase B